MFKLNSIKVTVIPEGVQIFRLLTLNRFYRSSID